MTKEEIAGDKTITKKERIIRLFKAGVDKKEIQVLAKANPGEVYNALKAAGLAGKKTIEAEPKVRNPITGAMVSQKPKPILPEKEQDDEITPTPTTTEKEPKPEFSNYDRFLRALKSAKRQTTKELMDEFGIRDEQQMWGTAKRGDIFDKQYYMLSSMDRLGNDLRTLKVISKMWAITTTVSQKMVSHEEEGGRASEREYSVNRSVEINLQIFDKKTGEKLGSLTNSLTFIYGIGNDALPKAAQKIRDYFQSKDPNPPIPAEADVNFPEMVAKFHEKVAQKKLADAWKKEKVPAEKKQEARKKFSEWQKETMKRIKERLHDRGFKRGHPAYYEAEQKMEVLKDWVGKLIHHPIFYGYNMGYDYEVDFYEDKAYVSFQITGEAVEIRTSNPFHKYANERGDYKYYAAIILAEDINPILGTNFSGNGYSYGGNRVGFNIHIPKNYSGGRSAAQGVLVGHSDINGRAGIQAQQPDGSPIRLGGGEIIMNEKASTEHCEELSKWNQETGGIAFDCGLQKVANIDRATGKMPKDEWHQEMAGGGQIPSRYKDMGFTHVGHMIESTQPEKKWMVLAKKGDQYKVVHGGQKGMEDFSQHKDEARRRRFWDRMGGEDSEYTRDPFSPLYWHKKYGTWAGGGMAAATGIQINKNPTKDELRNVLSGIGEYSDGSVIQTIASHLRRNRSTGEISGQDDIRKKEEQRILIQYINENNLWVGVNLGEFNRGGEEQSVKLDSNHATKLSNAVHYPTWMDYFNSLLLHNLFFPGTKYELIGFYKLYHILLAVVRQPYIKLTTIVSLKDVERFMKEKGFNKTDGNNYKNTELGISIKDLHERNVLMKDDIPYFIDTHFVIDDKSILPPCECDHASPGTHIPHEPIEDKIKRLHSDWISVYAKEGNSQLAKNLKRQIKFLKSQLKK